MEFTLGNHLKYWIEDRLYGTRELPTDRYRVAVGAVDPDQLRTSSWLNEQYRTAEAVRDQFGKDFVVMFSGGTDSEIVLRSFLKVGVKPRAVFILFENRYNNIDYINAQLVCERLDINLEVAQVNVKEFYNSGAAAEFASEIACRQMAYLTVYNQIKQMGLPAVMGGEMLLRRHVPANQDSSWYYVIRENEDASAMRFSLKYNIPLVNEWFSYTPEMMAYYLQHPTIIKMVTDRFNYKLGSVSTKNSVLYNYMPALIRKAKTTGYEKLLGFNEETYNTLNQTHVRRLEPSLDGIPLTDLYKQLGIDDANS
jgi:predicted PP-loop superfamily ATPase